MSSEFSSPQTDALATLSLLDVRLRRLEFLLTGSADLDGRPTPLPLPDKPLQSQDSVSGRLRQLQHDFERLRKTPGPAGDLVRDVESLHSKVPEAFADPSSTPSTTLSDQMIHIFANASLYTETTSRLSSLQTLQVPTADQSSQYLRLRPRIDAARTKRDDLEARARDLRERSARCLEWWVRTGVVGMGELWAEWEERVRDAERATSRIEKLRSDTEGYI